MKTTIRIIYDKVLFDNYDHGDEVLKEYLLLEVNKRRRPDLDE